MINDYKTDPPENCQLTVKKLPNIFIFFKKIANGNFFEKNENCWQFFLKKCQVFGNFLTVNWQYSGGSDRQTDRHKTHHLKALRHPEVPAPAVSRPRPSSGAEL